MTKPTGRGRRAGDTVETPGAFRGRVRAWLDANAPRKGEPGDFSAAHLVSAGTPGGYRLREREALGVTMAWQGRLFDAGFAGRSWPREYGGAGAPAWQVRGMATRGDLVRRGIGRALLAYTVAALDVEDGPRLLWCTARVEALGFWQREGWTVASDVFDIPDVGPHRVMRRVL